ncbi:MAG: hypothetical protein ACOX3T_00605 [Bdellovibrionota bacterium]
MAGARPTMAKGAATQKGPTGAATTHDQSKELDIKARGKTKGNIDNRNSITKLKSIGVNEAKAEIFMANLSGKATKELLNAIKDNKTNKKALEKLSDSINSIADNKVANIAEKINETLGKIDKDVDGNISVEEIIKQIENAKEELAKEERERIANERQRLQTPLNKEQKEEYQKLSAKVEAKAKEYNLTKDFKQVQERWNGSTVESLEIMQAFANLSETQSLHKNLQSLHKEIFSDVLKTYANPDEINQGKYDTCVASSLINSAIREGQGARILEIALAELKDPRKAFLNTKEGSYLHTSLNSDMLGGVAVGALMLQTYNGGFDHLGRVLTKGGSVKKGTSESEVIAMYKKIHGDAPYVIENETFRKLQDNPEELQKLIKANNGINAVLKWDENKDSSHAYHMIRVTGIEKKDGKWVVNFVNSQDEKLLNKENKAKVDSLSLEDFSDRFYLALINNNEECVKIIEGLGGELLDGDEIKDTLSDEGKPYPHNSSPNAKLAEPAEGEGVDTGGEGQPNVGGGDGSVYINKQSQDGEGTITDPNKDGTGITTAIGMDNFSTTK